MGDDEIFDAVIDGVRDNAALQQIELRMIGPVTDDPSRPALGDTGDLQ